MLKYFWPALGYGEKVGRIYYRGSCQLGLDADLAASFPQLDIQPPSKGRSGVTAVRDIFRHDKDISVKESDPGIIRVRIGNVPDAVLRVKISNLVLTPEEQYNYWLAIFKMENAPEVQSAMQDLNIRTRTDLEYRDCAAGRWVAPPSGRDHERNRGSGARFSSQNLQRHCSLRVLHATQPIPDRLCQCRLYLIQRRETKYRGLRCRRADTDRRRLRVRSATFSLKLKR